MLWFTLYLRVIFQVQAPGVLYLEGRFNEGFLALPVWGLIFGGAYFRILRYDFMATSFCSPHARESVFQNPGNFSPWNQEIGKVLFVQSGILGFTIRYTFQEIRNLATGVQHLESVLHTVEAFLTDSSNYGRLNCSTGFTKPRFS